VQTRTLFLALAIWFAPTVALADGSPHWTSIGPTYITGQFGGESGRVVSLQLSGGVLYAAASGGGIWRRDPATGAWQPIGDDLPSLGIGAFAVDAANPDVMYVGTGWMDDCTDCPIGVGIFKLAKNGWTRMNIDATAVSEIRIDPKNSDRVWVATNAGLYRTLNGGGEWAMVYPPTPQVSSPDALAVTDVVLDPNNSDTVYIGTHVAGVLKSTNANATPLPTWTGEPLPYPAGVAVTTPQNIRLAIASDSPATVYAAVASLANAPQFGCLVGLYKSPRGGVWQDMHAPDYFSDAFPKAQPGGEKWCQGDYDNVVAVDPANPDRLVAGGMELAQTSTASDWKPDGSSWIQLGAFANLLHPDQHALLFAPDGSLFIGNDGGIWKITKDGSFDLRGTSGINPYNQGLPITQFYTGSEFNDGAVVLGGTQDNGTNLRDINGWSKGTTAWLTVDDGDGYYGYIDPQNASHWYFEEFCISINRTANRVSTDAQPLKPPATASAFYAPYVVDPNDPGTLYFGADELWKYNDQAFVRGSSEMWKQISNNGGSVGSNNGFCQKGRSVITAMAISRTNPVVVMFVRNNSDLYRSVGVVGSYSADNVNAGWITVPLPNSDNLNAIAIDPSDSAHVAIATLNQSNVTSVYETTMTGASPPNWGEPLGSAIIRGANVLKFTSAGLLLGSDQGLWRFEATSKDWVRFGTGMPPVSVYDVIPTEKGRLVVLTHGRGAWISDGPVTEPTAR
jgi:hypothetical protein